MIIPSGRTASTCETRPIVRHRMSFPNSPLDEFVNLSLITPTGGLGTTSLLMLPHSYAIDLGNDDARRADRDTDYLKDQGSREKRGEHESALSRLRYGSPER